MNRNDAVGKTMHRKYDNAGMKRHTHQSLATLLVSAIMILPGHASTDSRKQSIDDACWTQTFEDSFDELSLWTEHEPEGMWRTRYIWPRDTIINDEEQFYIDPVEHGMSPFSAEDSILTIEAIPTPGSLKSTVGGQAYVSGVLTTEKSFAQKYGRFEVRARVTAGQGLWSAFWLLPSFPQWPEGVAILPEIDVMEHLGQHPNTYHTTLHTNQTGKLTSHPYDHTSTIDLTEDFHLYSVVWTPTEVNWYLNGEWKASHPTPRDFTRPVHFLLNLAVGGRWPGSPDSSTVFPAHFQVDFVRAWTDNGTCSD